MSLTRMGKISQYNAKKQRGRLRDSFNGKEYSFNGNVVKEGVPSESDIINYTIDNDGPNALVTEIIIREKALRPQIQCETPVAEVLPFPEKVKPIQIEESHIAHVLTVYHPQIVHKANVILSHALKLAELNKHGKRNSIYWGKLIENTGKATPGITEEWTNSVNKQIAYHKGQGKLVKLIVTDFHDVYIAPLRHVYFNKNLNGHLEKYKQMPDYYTTMRDSNRPCEVFFEIDDLFKIERDLLLNNLKFVENGVSRDYSPYESNITYPLQVIDENYMFDDGFNFDKETISNEHGAHFYDITNNDRSHDEETVNNITMNLMDDEAWSELPALTRTYLIEAEEAYARAFDVYKNNMDAPVKKFRISLSYFNAIEALINHPAGRSNDDFKAPYLDFKVPYMKKNNIDKKSQNKVVKDFFFELGRVSPSEYSSINRLKRQQAFQDNLGTHNRALKLYGFIEKLCNLRNIDAHPEKNTDEDQYYTFKQLKEIRDAMWGINTLEKIKDNSSGLGMINLLLKLYLIYDKKHEQQRKSA